MKSMYQKQIEALTRLEESIWENSKAKRKGTKTKAEWQKSRQKQIVKLSAKIKISRRAA